MNNPSPLIPQGSMLEQKNKGRARVKIAVFLVLAVHGVGLMALLMQGCKKEPDANTAAVSDQTTNLAAPTFEQTNMPVADTNPPVVPTNPSTAVVSAPPSAPTAGQTDYKIAQGDTFSTLAKKFHVSIKAIEDANPGLEPTKLKIGQTVHIPAATVAMAAAASAPGPTADNAGSGQTYVVKSGDSLSKIAGEFGTTVKALRSVNSLTTDKIVVGQKLKVPVKATATGAAADTTTSASSSGPATASSDK